LKKKDSSKNKATHIKMRLDTLEDDNTDLAAIIDLSGKRRKMSTPTIKGSSEVASMVSIASSHGGEMSSYQATLLDCMPMMTSRSKYVIIADETASPHAPSSTASNLNAAIAHLIHAEGLNFYLSEKSRFQYMIYLATFAPPGYEPPKRKLIAGRLLVSNH
jgi:hypothetical protein